MRRRRAPSGAEGGWRQRAELGEGSSASEGGFVVVFPSESPEMKEDIAHKPVISVIPPELLHVLCVNSGNSTSP